MQTKEFDSVLNSLKTKTTELGGYVENSSISGNSYSYTTTRYASYTIRIPADKLNEFVDIVGELGNVTQENESVEDVTLQYVDVEKSFRNGTGTFDGAAFYSRKYGRPLSH